MTDYFALFQEPRRPWLEPELLNDRFRAFSIEHHPDRCHQAAEADRQAAERRFAELNVAYQCLREPKTRLRHLLELEEGEKPAQVRAVPPALVDRFAAIGEACREASAFLTKKAKPASAILEAQRFQRSLEWIERLQDLQRKLNHDRESLLAELRRMNAQWDAAPPVGSPDRRPALPLDRADEVCRTLGFYDRWLAQIQERLVQLAL